ncbi:MAG: hypothetical protein KIT18_02445 [Burkholderiales bacterium]|nr:hypothetical protein [Burkholderiales bacterium]
MLLQLPVVQLLLLLALAYVEFLLPQALVCIGWRLLRIALVLLLTQLQFVLPLFVLQQLALHVSRARIGSHSPYRKHAKQQ